MKNPYEVLGLKKNATDKQIKDAFKKMSKKVHPDKGGSDEAFIEVKKAYEILSDPIKRKMYDTHGFVEEKKVEQSIYNEVHQMFFTIISTNPMAYNTDMVSTMINAINDNISQAAKNIIDLDKQITNIEKYRGKIKLKEGVESENIFDNLIDGKIIQIEQEKEFWASFPEKLNKLKEVISQYESNVFVRPPSPFNNNTYLKIG